MKMILFFGSLLILFSSNTQIQTSNQQWMQYYTQVDLAAKWTFVGDGGFRWQNQFQNNSAYIVRSGFAYSINSKMRIATGFAHLGIFESTTLSKMEFRPYQEFLFKKIIGKIKTEHRFRLEERIFNSYVPHHLIESNSFILRYRYQFLLQIPIWKFSNDKPNQFLALTFSNEIFLKTARNSSSFFDQNRIIIGPTLHFNDRLNISFNYNAQIGKSTNALNYSSVFWFTIKQRFPLNN